MKDGQSRSDGKADHQQAEAAGESGVGSLEADVTACGSETELRAEAVPEIETS